MRNSALVLKSVPVKREMGDVREICCGILRNHGNWMHLDVAWSPCTHAMEEDAANEICEVK